MSAATTTTRTPRYALRASPPASWILRGDADSMPYTYWTGTGWSERKAHAKAYATQRAAEGARSDLESDRMVRVVRAVGGLGR